MTLKEFLESFPDDSASTLLATMTDAGAVITGSLDGGRYTFVAEVEGKRYVGRGETPKDAAVGVLMSYGRELRR